MNLTTSRTRRRLLGLATAITAAALVGPASASASSLSLSARTLQYTGAPAEANHLTISYDAGQSVYVLNDTGVASINVPTPHSQQDCRSYTATIAYCPYGGFASIVVHLGNGGSFAQSTLALTSVTMYAGTGNDTLIGGGGFDSLFGGAGTDTLRAGSGPTRLVAGSGNATMYGGTGIDSYQGGPGADTIHARNGHGESVACGAGNDAVEADPGDTAAADCESVDRGGAAAPPAPTASTDTLAPPPSLDGSLPGAPDTVMTPAAAVSTAPVQLTAGNRVPLEVTCPATSVGACLGTVTLTLPAAPQSRGKAMAARRVRRVLGRSKRFRIAAGQKAVVPVTLSRRGVRAFRRSSRTRRSFKVIASVTTRSEAGTKTIARTLTVRAERRRPTPHRNRSNTRR